MIKHILEFICCYVPWTIGILIIASTIHSFLFPYKSPNDIIEDDISEEDDYEE